MRRQHQAVTLAAPGNMIAESTPVRDLAFFPLDRHILIEFGHSRNPRKGILFQAQQRTQKKPAEHPGHNDAYARQTLGKKHPWALGKPAREVWAEIWADLDSRVRTVTETGEATWDEGLLLFLECSGYPEETYHTFSYSPLTGDDGKINGLFCVVMEETSSARCLPTLSAMPWMPSATAEQ
jgi:hypothetical protein